MFLTQGNDDEIVFGGGARIWCGRAKSLLPSCKTLAQNPAHALSKLRAWAVRSTVKHYETFAFNQ